MDSPNKFLFVLLALFALTTSRSLKATLASQPTLSYFNGYLEQFDLIDEFDARTDITVLAPTNQAYTSLAQWGFNLSLVEPFIARALLQYHFLEGRWTSQDIPSAPDAAPNVVHTFLQPPILTNVSSGAAVKLQRSGSTIITESGLQVVGAVETADIKFHGGVLHSLNSSMVLPHNISVTAEFNGLSQFLEHLDTAHVVGKIESLKDVTVFIPQNTAWENIDTLLHRLDNRKLAAVLGFHIVPGKVLYREDLAKGNGEFETLQGATLKTRVQKDGSILVGGAKVVRSDLILYGGVAHVIDEVLVPSLTERDRTGEQNPL